MPNVPQAPEDPSFWLGFGIGAIVVSIMVLITLVVAVHAEGRRHYFAVASSAMAHNFHTHVQVEGKVTVSERERDGDWHIRIEDEKGFVVAECIPELPCVHPRIGQCVRVRGISRFDGEHKWYEVHPVEKLEVIPCRN